MLCVNSIADMYRMSCDDMTQVLFQIKKIVRLIVIVLKEPGHRGFFGPFVTVELIL